MEHKLIKLSKGNLDGFTIFLEKDAGCFWDCSTCYEIFPTMSRSDCPCDHLDNDTLACVAVDLCEYNDYEIPDYLVETLNI